MKRFAWTGLLLLAGAGMAHMAHAESTRHCRADQLSTVGGPYLYTTTGQRYQIYPGQAGRTAAWLPLDQLEICRIGGNAYSITDRSARGQSVNALYKP